MTSSTLFRIVLLLSYGLIAARAAPLPTAFFFPGFLNHPMLNFVGDSRTEVVDLVIAGPGRRQTGAVWFAQTFDMSDGFFAEFTVTISQVDNNGGEGFAFVVQKDGPYALGNGGEGIGYDSVGEGIAIEFDGKRDAGQVANSKDPEDAGAHFAIRKALIPGERLQADHTKDVIKGTPTSGDQVVAVPNMAKFNRPIHFRVDYQADSQELSFSINQASYNEPAKWSGSLKATVGQFLGGDAYYVGFTAATGDSSAARFAITNWKFGLSNRKFQGCVKGFTGPECSVTNEEARRECPRRETCLGCVRDVYNCVWCRSSKTGGSPSCVAGIKDIIEQCNNDIAVEDMGCSSNISLIWLWISIGVFSIVFCFGFILVRLLPRAQAFRAVSILVSLGCGAIFGMLLSFVVAASLVEISSTPMFSLAFGVFFFYLGGLITLEIIKNRQDEEEPFSWTWEQVASCFAVVWIVFAGLLCFILDKKIVMWLPEAVKVLMFMVLAAALNFCIVFSTVDIYNELYERWTRRATSTPGLSEILDAEARKEMFATDRATTKSRVLTVARSKARYGLLIFASLVSGLYFGLIFGLMRIEEEEIYRAALMLRQESIYTFPAGALIGGMSGLLLQIITLPFQSDGEIDRIINEVKDDL